MLSIKKKEFSLLENSINFLYSISSSLSGRGFLFGMFCCLIFIFLNSVSRVYMSSALEFIFLVSFLVRLAEGLEAHAPSALEFLVAEAVSSVVVFSK